MQWLVQCNASTTRVPPGRATAVSRPSSRDEGETGDDRQLTSYVVRRVLGAIPLLLAIVVIIFFITRLVPGDPVSAMLPENATELDRQRLTDLYGLNDPVFVQFWKYLVQLLHGNLGTSFQYHSSVSELLWRRLPATLDLAIAALLFGWIIGIALGAIASTKHNKWQDRTASIVGLIGISAPTFWIGLLLIIYVAVPTGWFPTGGRLPADVVPPGPTGVNLIDAVIHLDPGLFFTTLRYLALPAITLGAAMTGLLVRMTRSSMLEVLGDDYIRTARAKGARESTVNFRHALRNAGRPVATVMGLEAASLLSGSIVVETIFSWPGLGQTLVNSVDFRDYPVIQATVLMFAIVFVLTNLAVDIAYCFIDPRIKY
jgi:ABC-type dipeptide/oligopeptide/nickel transport system permease component